MEAEKCPIKNPFPIDERIKNLACFEADKENIMVEFPDRWVAIKNGKVIAAADHHAFLNEVLIALMGRNVQEVSIISTQRRPKTN